mgnify:FL=1
MGGLVKSFESKTCVIARSALHGLFEMNGLQKPLSNTYYTRSYFIHAFLPNRESKNAKIQGKFSIRHAKGDSPYKCHDHYALNKYHAIFTLHRLAGRNKNKGGAREHMRAIDLSPCKLFEYWEI